MIYFEKIRFKNFLSYGNKWTEIDLKKSKKTILLGESGSGKSTFLDALKFVCFNKPYRNITKPQLVNSINSKDCVVEVEFSKGTKNFKIIRGIKPNIFEIYCDGVLVNQDASVRDYQIWLEKNVFGFNARCFDQIVVVGAANFTPFMELKPQERRVIIEELLDLQIFGVMNNILKDKVSSNKEEILNLENTLHLLKEKMKIHKSFIKDLEKDKKEKIELIKQKIEDKDREISDNKISIEQLEKEVLELSGKLTDEKDINSSLMDINAKQSQLRKDITSCKKEITFYSNNTNCNVCKQYIDEKFKENKIEETNNNIIISENELNQIEKEIESLIFKKESLEKIKVELNKKEKDLSVSQSILKNLQSNRVDLENEMNKLLSPTQNITDEKSKLKKLFEDYKNKEKLKEEKNNDKIIYDYAQNLLRDNGVKSQIIKEYLPLINQHTNKFLSLMNFFTNFYIDENFNESIKSRGFDDFTFCSFSEGEKQRLNLALLFTWRAIANTKNSVSTNLLVMDEVFDSYLDLEATENVLEILDSSLFKNINVFVISHKNIIADKFDDKIEFTKVKNFSEVK
jgi:DNA repair exonuclease SbcCD ATPase subunit